MTEVRGQMTDDRGQMTDDRGQRTDDRGQRTDVRKQKTDVGRQSTDVKIIQISHNVCDWTLSSGFSISSSVICFLLSVFC